MKKNQFKALLLFPTLLSFAFVHAQTHEENISAYFRNENSLSKTPFQLKEFKISNVDTSESLKGDVVVVQQEIDGIPLFSKSATFFIKKNKINYVANGFSNTINVNKIAKAKPSISEINAFTVFANSIKLKDSSSYKSNRETTPRNLLKNNPSENIKTDLVYFQKENEARLAYKITFNEKGTSNSWLAIVDANNSEILFQLNTTIFDHFHKQDLFLSQDYDSENAKKTVAFPLNKSINSRTYVGAKYNVFKLPVEAPTFGNRSIVNEPFNDSFAPFGWNDTKNPDFEDLKEYTVGNNVVAYSDEEGKDNLMDLSQLAHGGTDKNFDFSFDINSPVSTYRDASITNLFYMNNVLHDIAYQFGFTETARNFQFNNNNKGGEENDFVIAEARDGGGYNNANFQVGSDGNPSKMQMYLWSPKFVSGIEVNSPQQIENFSTNTAYPADILDFPKEGITGDIAVALPENGCSEITNAENLKDKIALIKRGDCTFQEKYINAINTGAKAIIYYNATDSQTIGSFGSGALDPEAPAYYSVLIDHKGGEELVTALNTYSNINVTLSKDFSSVAQPDGSLDNGIIAHEYTHGISNRLTGLGDGSCLMYTESNEQMGEGWSDYLALMLTLKPTDNKTIPRGIGSYAVNQETTGLGIRPAKYSPDFNINNFTYGKTNGMEVPASMFGVTIGTAPDVHSIGFVWATMLWDLTWNYVEKYGYNNDTTADKNSGTARALQLVMDGMKLQKCNPSFIDGRDAILAADEVQTGGENKCLIWNSFAKRGLGINASPGGLNGAWYNNTGESNPDLHDQVENFNVPKECELTTTEINKDKQLIVSPNPAKDEIFINAKTLKGNYNIKIYNMTGILVKDLNYNPAHQKSIHVSNLANGVYVIKIDGEKISHSQKLIIKK